MRVPVCGCRVGAGHIGVGGGGGGTHACVQRVSVRVLITCVRVLITCVRVSVCVCV